MRSFLLLVAFSFVFISLNSCQKEVEGDIVGGGGGTGQPPPSNTRLYRIQEGTDPNLDNDTIWIINYTADGKMHSITDSLYADSNVATYDASGRITEVKGTYGDKGTFIYNASGQLTEIRMLWAGAKEKYVFTYTNGVVSKKSYFTDAGTGGAQFLWRDFEYTLSGGNITNIKVLDKNGAVLGNETRTYGSQQNNFKDVALFNYGGQMGTSQLIDVETYFSKNLVTGGTYNVSGTTSYSYTNAYTMNAQQAASKAVMNLSYGDVFTWQFYYK